MTHFSKAISRETIEIYLKSHCDVLLNILHNGPGGFSAIVKSCFIPKSPYTLKNRLNNIQGVLV